MAFPDAESIEYWAWCQSHGIREDAELAWFAPPVPPEDLRVLIGAGVSSHQFLTSGAELFLSVSRILKLNESRALLDFGCGCGRLLRFLSLYSGQVDLVGVDAEPRHLRWDSCHLTFASFALNYRLPPLLFRAGRFDTIICLSVLSHLRAATHRAWMEEFARILPPHGRIIITTLGLAAIQASLETRSSRSILEISRKKFSHAQAEFLDKGFSFVAQPTQGLDDYGIALTSETWIRECWGRHFEVLASLPGWLGGWQDGFLLQRRPA
jgi:2-polyprenyl-3-methyl-5-hydroxy-6-metoxy-1,4-benzoquinol methylase